MPDRTGRSFAQGLLTDLRPIFTPRMVLAAWIPCLVITVLHYRTGSQHPWGHDILRRLYYLPILFAAFAGGLRGGVTLSVFASLVYLPHAFTSLLVQDPAGVLEKGLEIILYNIVAVVAGLLVDRERREREQQEKLATRLGDALEEQRRIEAQLIRAGKLGALGELTAGIAHEIKNPLHALKGTAEILRDAVPEGVPERRMLELHIAEIDRLDQTADRFLSFARPIPASLRPVEPESLIDRVLSLVSTQARQVGVETVVAARGAGNPPKVTGDPDLLVQLLLNIALNGVQAMAPGGGGTLTFSLGTVRQGGKAHVRFRIVNTGPPIPEEELERVFDPFHTTKDGGTGLGLAISSRIADQHQGTLSVRNLPAGGGVEFFLVLPAAEAGDG
ncbi:sensor histidine kinase [bacterium]|nr:sensor histidine kinase [bacterium]